MLKTTEKTPEVVTKPGLDETGSSFRFRLRDPDDFIRLRTIPFKRSRPQIQAVAGPLKSTRKVALQTLIFPKKQGWDRDRVRSWLDAHPDVGKDVVAVEADWEEAVGLLAWNELEEEPKAVEDADEAEAEAMLLLLKEPARATDDEFLPIRRHFDVEVKADEEEDTAEVTISTGRLDRDREVVEPDGMRLPKPFRLPLVAGHSYGDLKKQIGELAKPRVDGDKVVAKVKWYVGMGNPEADWAAVLMRLGSAAFSIGFKPIKWEDADLADEKVLEKVRQGKLPLRVYTEWELMEVSQVILPSNRDAIQRMIEAGILPKEQGEALVAKAEDRKLGDRAQAGLEAALEAYAELLAAQSVEELPEVVEDEPKVAEDEKAAKPPETGEDPAKTAPEEEEPKVDEPDIMKLLESSEKTDEKEKTDAEASEKAAKARGRKVLIDTDEVELWVPEGEDKLLLAFRGATRDLVEKLHGTGLIVVESSVKGEAFIRELEAWRSKFSAEITDVFEKALAKAGEKMALPPNSAAFVTVEKLVTAVIAGVSEMVDQRIARARGDVDAWLGQR